MKKKQLEELISTLKTTQHYNELLRDKMYELKKQLPTEIIDFYEELPPHSAFSEIIDLCEELKGEKSNGNE